MQQDVSVTVSDGVDFGRDVDSPQPQRSRRRQAMRVVADSDA